MMKDPEAGKSPPRAPSTSEVIIRDFELETVEGEKTLSEEELFELLADQVDYFIQYRLEHLFSLLYRMDVREDLVRAAMDPRAPEPAHRGIARLILNRQKQRLHTKKTIRPEELGEDWAW